jgi:hypothetical protein
MDGVDVVQVIVVGVVDDEDSRSVFFVCAVFVAVKPTLRCLIVYNTTKLTVHLPTYPLT